MTNFRYPITVGGVPMTGNQIPATKGKTLFVDYGSGQDGRAGTDIKHPLKTLKAAYDLATTNMDDVIVLMGSTTHTLTEMLTVSKNRVHFVGLDGTARKYGQNAKVTLGVTTAATDIGTIKNTGTRNSFANIKFVNENTVAEGLYCFVEGGEYTVIENCEIYKSTDLNETGAAEMVLNGDSVQIRGCTIGSLANQLVGTIIRPCILLTKGLAGAGKVARDCEISDTNFWRNGSHVNNRYVYGANADDVERLIKFENCDFVNNKLALAVPAQCIASGSSLSAGYGLIKNCNSIGNTKLSTTTGYLITGAVPTYATSGIAVQS